MYVHVSYNNYYNYYTEIILQLTLQVLLDQNSFFSASITCDVHEMKWVELEIDHNGRKLRDML